MDDIPKYIQEIHRVGHHTVDGVESWTATPAIRVNENGETQTVNLDAVEAANEDDVRNLASAASEKWIHEDMKKPR
ncbi:hypothetical protein DT603_09330 [Pseudoxanthomonas gei]|uniref:Aldehyde dehydrogenase domain-containing protein n=1 Tax=Pseudoxanthomonas gei TaxID=1383030 RepID=A0ABX0AHP8_9GAMM|nr:hypothetical protein [Pseudoxanthomonas gei]NDK39041.1 hypothetical protein [Pseudoxanthomonas gei]